MKVKLKKSLIVASVSLCVLANSQASLAQNNTFFARKNIYNTSTFVDISNSSWYFNDVKEVYELGVMNGKGNNRFDPSGSITIAEAINMSAKIHSVYNKGDLRYEGMTWYYGPVEYAKKNGIISPNEIVKYDRIASRGEIINLLSKSLPADKFKNIYKANSLPDLGDSNAYKDSILLLYNAGIISGVDDKGNVAPNKNVSRAEAAAIMNRIVTLVNNPHKLDPKTPDNYVKTIDLDILENEERYDVISQRKVV